MDKYRRKGAGSNYADFVGEESQSLLTEDYLQLGNLHPKKREDGSPAARSPKDQTIECDIQPTDTLQSLALKYNIPLAELKRVNNILQENEFFALKRIKIPVKPASFLKDLIPGVHSEENRRENGWYVDHKDTPNSFSSSLSSRQSTGYSSPVSEAELAPVFQESKDKKKVRRLLKEMDRDLERIKERQSSNNKEDADEELEDVNLDHSVEEVLYTNFNHPQEDSGLSNGSLVCWCFLLVLLTLSLLAILSVLMSVDHHSSEFTEEVAASGATKAGAGAPNTPSL